MNVSFLPRILHEILRPGIVPSVGRGRLGGGRGGDMLLGTRRPVTRWDRDQLQPDHGGGRTGQNRFSVLHTSTLIGTGVGAREYDQHRHVRRRTGAGGQPGQGVRCPGVRGMPQENTRQVCTQGKIESFSPSILLVLTAFRITWSKML